MKITLVLLSFLLLFSAAPALAAPAGETAEITRVQDYLNGIKTMQARFVQTDPGNEKASGTFYLKRPGRLRFEYDPPVADFIVADGIFLYFYDGQAGEQSNMPIGNSLADFFLRKRLDLAGDVTVTDFQRKPGGLIALTLTQTADPAAGTLTIFLSDAPLALKKWKVVDAQGLTTTVELSDAVNGPRLKDSLFYYRDPEKKNTNINR